MAGADPQVLRFQVTWVSFIQVRSAMDSIQSRWPNVVSVWTRKELERLGWWVESVWLDFEL